MTTLLGPLGRVLLQGEVTAQEFGAWLTERPDELSDALGMELYAELAFISTEAKSWDADVRRVLDEACYARVRRRAVEAAGAELGARVVRALRVVAKEGAPAEAELCELYRWYCDGASVLEPIACTWGLHSALMRDEQELPADERRPWEPPSTDARAAAAEVLDEIVSRGVSFRLHPKDAVGRRIEVVDAASARTQPSQD